MLKDILTDELVATEVAVNNWREAAAACGELLVKAKKIEPAFINSMIEVVEEFGPYMILVPEVIFFHGRPSADVKETCLSFITLKEPVYFTEYDNQKISCAFAFGAIDNSNHIELLRQLSALLQNEEFVKAAITNGDKSDLMTLIERY